MTTDFRYTNEIRAYQQAVYNDTLLSATWSVSPTGPVLSGQVDTSSDTTIFFTSAAAGIFALKALLVLASGQQLEGVIHITVQAQP